MYLHFVDSIQQYIIPVLLGIGLSAACGLRVFLPLFALSVLARLGAVPIADNFEWILSWPAIITFGSATIFEILAYYIPLIDNVLDMVTIPSSIAAGTIILASTTPELESTVRWTLAMIAGGGTAGIISVGTSLIRAKSTIASGGTANFIVATLETIGSLLMSLLAILLPVIAALIVLWLIYSAIKNILRRKKMPEDAFD